MGNHHTSARRLGITRRRFIQLAAAAALLGACAPTPAPQAPEATPRPTTAPSATSTATAAPSATTAPTPMPASPAPTATGTATATAAPTGVPNATPTPPALARVAIAQAASYEPALVRRQVQALLDGIGGLAGIVHPGDRVAIKVNLSGGSYYGPPAGVSETESYMTHPEVVRALAELVRDAGAREIAIVEALFDDGSFHRYGYDEAAGALGAALVDINRPDPHNDFASLAVGPGWFIYDRIVTHRLLQEVDALISVAKMKAHCRAGVTLAMKNLVGIVPASHYRLSDAHWHRSALHGATDAETRTRLPRAIVDICRARPIHLALVDGIRTGQGGEVPRGDFAPLSPGVLVAGRDPVAADAVAAAVMGFDPAASYPNPPFVNGDNHLELARQMGLGTNRLGEIEVVGARIADVRQQFKPCWRENG